MFLTHRAPSVRRGTDITSQQLVSRQGGGAVVRIHELSVTFPGKKPVLDGMGLEVREGEFVAIVGHSGCGKTTLLNVLAGLVPVSGGQVHVLGRSPRAGRDDICYLLARDALLPWRTVSRNVEFGLELSGVRAAERRTIATTILDEVGLAGFGGYYPSALSQGMRQRASLARGFAVDRPVYLMDEPFSALDAETRLLLHGQLLRLWEKRRRVVLFVTHDIAEAVLLSDRVIVLGAGRILADIPIPLERPRAANALQGEDAFHSLYRDVWRQLTRGEGAP